MLPECPASCLRILMLNLPHSATKGLTLATRGASWALAAGLLLCWLRALASVSVIYFAEYLACV